MIQPICLILTETFDENPRRNSRIRRDALLDESYEEEGDEYFSHLQREHRIYKRESIAADSEVEIPQFEVDSVSKLLMNKKNYWLNYLILINNNNRF